ncbi:DNA primase (plasmid) [Mycoplasmatota bacterium]|nr:DNA primase [Mycoplasmatota bacterium]
MKQIPDSVRNEILEKINILDYINNYVKLEKRGKNWMGLSPFNIEKTPSFVVSPERNSFNDYSSGIKGNVITFVMEYEKVNYPQAIKTLANYTNIDISSYISNDNINQFNKELKLNQFIKEYYQFSLQTIDGKRSLQYLQNRGLAMETINKFEIGHAIIEKNNELYQALKSNGFDDKVIKNTNNLNDKNSNKFQNRVIIPIIENGKVVGFGGRTLSDDKRNAKYLNSENSVIFNKYNTIFNLDNAKVSCRKEDSLFLLEGFMDVISLDQQGISNTVATMGTALTNQHIKKMKNLSNNWFIVYDGDKAGIFGIKKAFEEIKKSNLDINAKAVILPYGLDPDEYIQKYGKNTFLDITKNNAMNYIEFNMYVLEQELKLNNCIENKVKFIEGTFDLIKNLKNVEIEHYLRDLAKRTFTTYDSIKSDFVIFIERENKQELTEQISKDNKDKSINENKKDITNLSQNKSKKLSTNDLLKIANNHIAEIVYNPIKFKTLLNTMTQFNTESIYNICLIHKKQELCNIIPTNLDTYQNYKDKGIFVKKGSTAFNLLKQDILYLFNDNTKKYKSKLTQQEVNDIETGKLRPSKQMAILSTLNYFDISDTTDNQEQKEHKNNYQDLIKSLGKNIILKYDPSIKTQLSDSKTYYNKNEKIIYFCPKYSNEENFKILLRITSKLYTDNKFESSVLNYLLDTKYNILTNNSIEYVKTQNTDQKVQSLNKCFNLFKNFYQTLEQNKEIVQSIER